MKLFLLILCAFLNFYAYGQNSFSSERAVFYALNHNYDIEKGKLNRALTDEIAKEVLSSGLPKINASVGYQNNFQIPISLIPGEITGNPGTFVPVQFGVQHNASAGVSLSQLIFDGRFIVGMQARSVLKKAALQQYTISEIEVKSMIQKSYFQAVTIKESLTVLRSNKVVLDDILKQAQATYHEGFIEELDVDRLKYNVKTLEYTIENLENQHDIALFALKLNMGYPLDSAIILTENIDRKVDNIILSDISYSQYFKDREELQLANTNIELKEYDVKQLKSSALPSVYGSAAYGYQSPSETLNYLSDAQWFSYGNFGIQMNIPLFTGLTRKFQISQANIKLKNAIVERDQLLDALKFQNIQSIITLKNSITEYKKSNALLELSQKIEDKTKIKYKEGVGSSLDFAIAQNDRIQRYLSTIQLKLGIINSYIEYRKSNGNL